MINPLNPIKDMIKPGPTEPRDNRHEKEQHEPQARNRSVHNVHLLALFGGHLLGVALLFLGVELQLCDAGGRRAGEDGLDELLDLAACDADFEEIGVFGRGLFVDHFDVAEKDFADSAEIRAFQHQLLSVLGITRGWRGPGPFLRDAF